MAKVSFSLMNEIGKKIIQNKNNAYFVIFYVNINIFMNMKLIHLSFELHDISSINNLTK